MAPQPKLPLAHRKAIGLDYGMRAGQISLGCRQAFVFYVLKHPRLPLATAASLKAREHPIVLKNWRDIARALSEA